MGKYAEDSWKLFCEKDDNWMEECCLESEDKILQLYIDWRRHQYKISKGLGSEETFEKRNIEEEKNLKGKEQEISQEKSQNDLMEISAENSSKSLVKKYENENYLSLQELNNLDISSILL